MIWRVSSVETADLSTWALRRSALRSVVQANRPRERVFSARVTAGTCRISKGTPKRRQPMGPCIPRWGPSLHAEA